MLLRTTLAGVRAHPGRLAATLLVVALGVGFASGTMIFGDTVKVSFFDQFARAARNVDVEVLAPEPTASHSAASPPVLPVATLDAVRAVPGVAGAEGRYSTRLPFLIALVGIANTVSLSVVERRRELAVQRALGMTRGQLSATLLVEALLMAAVGGLVGTGFGLGCGALLARTMFAEDLVLAVPAGQLFGYVVLAAAAGVLAALVPARRAARVILPTGAG